MLAAGLFAHRKKALEAPAPGRQAACGERADRSAAVKDSALKPEALAELAKIVDGGLISAKIAQDIFSELYANGVMPEAYVREKGLVQVSDTSAIDAAVAEVIAENPAEAEAYKGGKTKLISFFVGQVMRKMKGKANPALVNEALGRLLQ